jgi:hypothetical protein
MKGEIAIILMGLMLLPVIAVAKTQNTGSIPPSPTCQEWCQSQPHVACVGKWKISGKYPNCKCEFKCSESNDKPKNNMDNRKGPWNAVGKNKLLCIANVTSETQELLLINKKGKFEAWKFNYTDNSTTHYVAFPTSWYKPKVVEKKVLTGQWQLVNITETDPRVVQCGILPGMYIV